jgi:SPP1 gp7 family putative phage head morphogenesis protein
MIRRIKLTPEKAEWVGNRTVTLNGLPLMPNLSDEMSYRRDIEKMVRQMTETTQREVRNLFKRHGTMDAEGDQIDRSITTRSKLLLSTLSKRFLQLFRKNASDIVNKMINNTLKTNATTLRGSLQKLSGGLQLSTSAVPKGLEVVTQAMIAENVSLIRSIPEKYFTEVTGSVMRSITTGTTAQLSKDLQKYDGVTKRRAQNIAIDQTRKAYNVIGTERMKAAGIRKFKWVHSAGAQVPRHSHLHILNGKVFSFEDIEGQQAALGVPPEDRGMPGMPIRCGCIYVPVIEYEDGKEI